MLKRGIFIADRYEIVDKIGTGGMSDVYKAMDHTLGRYVAIKVLKEEFCEDMTFVTKFRTEAQSAAGLEHPNIVNVYDVGSENGFHYIVMEYVEGITLKTYIEKKGRLTYKEALSIAIQVGRGIQAAHAKNIIHRDIKPQNIIISTEGKVKVTDFGIARAVSEHTIHSDVMGSVHYVSPEQARNGYVSNKSDIYSLGIVMYEMVTGRVPFDGESTVAVAIKHLQDEMVAPSAYAKDLPISLEKIILKCTQKSPDRRYDSMESLLIDLRKALLSPNEDFVTMIPLSRDKTRVMSEDEVKEIQKKTSGVKASDTPEPEKKIRKKAQPEPDPEEDDDEAEEGRFLNSKMEKVVNIMRIVVAIVIVLIVVYIIGSFFDIFKFGPGKNNNNTSISEEYENDDKKEVTMIDLKGMTVSEARSELSKLGLSLREEKTEISEEYKKGEIISQTVTEGTKVKEGDTIGVVVSSGTEAENAKEVEVPDVRGYDSDTAWQMLEDANLNVKREFEYSEDVAASKVIRQDPEKGTTVKEGDTVTIYVSQGVESVKVPNVEEKTQSKAEAALIAVGLKCKVKEEYSDQVDSGKVISQSVEADKYVDKGTTVTITVSKGPEKSTYYYKANIKAPTNVTVVSADIELYKAESDDLVKSWTGVTEFPYSIEAYDIEDVPEGTLNITWYYEDEEGNTQSYNDSRNVVFKKQ